MQVSIELLLTIVASSFAAALGGYVAVRSDLAALKARVDRAEQDIQNIFKLKTKS